VTPEGLQAGGNFGSSVDLLDPRLVVGPQVEKHDDGALRRRVELRNPARFLGVEALPSGVLDLRGQRRVDRVAGRPHQEQGVTVRRNFGHDRKSVPCKDGVQGQPPRVGEQDRRPETRPQDAFEAGNLILEIMAHVRDEAADAGRCLGRGAIGG
jgi:hypothetical protein